MKTAILLSSLVIMPSAARLVLRSLYRVDPADQHAYPEMSERTRRSRDLWRQLEIDYVETAMSMPEGMSMSFDTTMSMSFDTTMSMSFDTTASMSFDTTMSFPISNPDETCPPSCTTDNDGNNGSGSGNSTGSGNSNGSGNGNGRAIPGGTRGTEDGASTGGDSSGAEGSGSNIVIPVVASVLGVGAVAVAAGVAYRMKAGATAVGDESVSSAETPL